MTDVRPSQRMRDLGVVQGGAGILAEPARAFDLPAERDGAERIIPVEEYRQTGRAWEYEGA
ncbi:MULTISPECIES: hypothetical protein [Streptomycetaceae]|uniref:Formylmethionine deformylase n=1 Tax=Streptantibioticus cattleyicolor (strain ATCC 35852 / DSM 46488 / JCM 4925 / NBRC 14057 / NRRL 8057) TaxID=1003195 RepID=F8JVM7_STREN|nr:MULTISPECIES: hypothetical protein [Streptomycetaceae]AEW95731.1 formylmethionine deformylase [Streptantibioticus cattleyicolor NRRL 8057 = DSM 46488]MYS60276.1 hypothetical protein [Streptomyces sp. SID5468]CCB76071.1 protein of unknown function [Streptantibioticus cattleyicolor NRRL 8057 = DSM 46488]